MVRNILKTHSPLTRALPASWARGIGLLKRHAQALKRHARTVRAEWGA